MIETGSVRSTTSMGLEGVVVVVVVVVVVEEEEEEDDDDEIEE